MWSLSRKKSLAVLISIGVLASSACANSGTASSGGTVDAQGLKVGMVGLYNLPYITATASGAKMAADEVGADFTQYGPQGLDPNKAIADFQNAVAAGNKGMLVFAYPGDLWARPLDRAIDQGVAVSTTDVYSETSKVTTETGSGKVAMGAALADAYLKQIPANATGEIVPGICVAGLEVLLAPLGGFRTRIEAERPGVKVIEPEVTSGDPAQNFAAWQRIIAKYPDALGFVGLCDVDVPNLVKLRHDDPDTSYLTGVTAGGDDPDAVEALRSGEMVGTITQRPWVQGYIGMKLILNHLTHGDALPDGWVNTGYDVVTKDNVDTILKVLSSAAEAKKYYGAMADEILANAEKDAHKPYTYQFDPASVDAPNPQP
jgi:ABC-type sugar transport system substrate-binding protein